MPKYKRRLKKPPCERPRDCGYPTCGCGEFPICNDCGERIDYMHGCGDDEDGFESDTPQADRMASPELQRVLADALAKQKQA